MTGAHPNDSAENRRRHFYLKRQSLLGSTSRGRRSGRTGGLLEAIGSAKLLAEALQSAGGVNKFLLARKERVAGAANIDCNAAQRAARGKRVSTCTVNRAGLITRMNFLFHDELLYPDRALRKITSTSAEGII
jgi:hypothetical protein